MFIKYCAQINTNMKHLILHVGITKTGSTSLQRFLYDNRFKLKEKGFNYPILNDKQKTIEKNGTVILESCIKNVVFNKPYEACRDNLFLNKSLNDCENVIISDEGFYSIIRRFNGVTYDEGRRLIYMKLSDYLLESNFDKVTFVVYLRQQHEHAVSFWKELIKHTTNDSFQDYLKQEYIKYVHDLYAFIKVMEECIEIPHEIIIRIYDRNNFVGGDIYHDFCDAIDLPWSNDYVIPEVEENLSFSYDVAEAFRTIRPCVPKKYIDKVIQIARNLSRANPDPKGLTPFTKEEIKEFMKQYEESNKEIASKYFSREQLFPHIDYDSVITWIPDDEKIRKYRKEILKECPLYTRILTRLYSIDFIRTITPHFIKKTIVRKLRKRR